MPAILVYRNHLEGERLRRLQEPPPKPLPYYGVFPPPDKEARLTNPISPAPECPCKDAQLCGAPVAAVQPVQESQTPAEPPTAPLPRPAPPTVPAAVPAQVTATAPQPASPVETAEVPPPPAAREPVVKPVEALLTDLVAVNWRDPLISPYDQQLQDEEALKALVYMRVEKDLADAHRRKRDRPAEQFVTLQGIVSLPDTKQAMVNGDAVMEGETIAVGPSNMAVRVVRIQENSVTFSHKGRTFTKRMSQ
ncbi:MAG: hypothetical protein HZB91_06945 [Elusimicrobia bacterium]|nr:hypothetical protein [Elusimicrobiota bacterium]